MVFKVCPTSPLDQWKRNLRVIIPNGDTQVNFQYCWNTVWLRCNTSNHKGGFRVWFTHKICFSSHVRKEFCVYCQAWKVSLANAIHHFSLTYLEIILFIKRLQNPKPRVFATPLQKSFHCFPLSSSSSSLQTQRPHLSTVRGSETSKALTWMCSRNGSVHFRHLIICF